MAGERRGCGMGTTCYVWIGLKTPDTKTVVWSQKMPEESKTVTVKTWSLKTIILSRVPEGGRKTTDGMTALIQKMTRTWSVFHFYYWKETNLERRKERKKETFISWATSISRIKLQVFWTCNVILVKSSDWSLTATVTVSVYVYSMCQYWRWRQTNVHISSWPAHKTRKQQPAREELVYWIKWKADYELVILIEWSSDGCNLHTYVCPVNSTFCDGNYMIR